MTRMVVVSALLLLAAVVPRTAAAHSGPPFPIVSDRIVGKYRASIWTDPDTTDDSRAAGQFWVRLDAAAGGRDVPAATRTSVTIRPLDRQGPPLTAAAAPVRGDVTNQFAALRMDHEGPFAVHVTIDGPLGPATIDAEVTATYDLRPAPYLIVLYLAPFVLVGLLWGRLLLRRRGVART